VISALLTYEWRNTYFDLQEKLWVHYKPSLFQHIGTHSSLKVSKLYITGITKYIYTLSTALSVPSSELGPPIPTPRGGYTLACMRVGGGGPNSDSWRLRKSLALCLLWDQYSVSDKHAVFTGDTCRAVKILSIN
jgi:hypothetical protein